MRVRPAFVTAQMYDMAYPPKSNIFSKLSKGILSPCFSCFLGFFYCFFPADMLYYLYKLLVCMTYPRGRSVTAGRFFFCPPLGGSSLFWLRSRGRWWQVLHTIPGVRSGSKRGKRGLWSLCHCLGSRYHSSLMPPSAFYSLFVHFYHVLHDLR